MSRMSHAGAAVLWEPAKNGPGRAGRTARVAGILAAVKLYGPYKM
jgi:hypothetical protein